MPVLEDDLKEYYNFIQEQVKLLGCLDIEGSQLVWHYTTGSSLINIIETGAIYSTQVSCLNDSTEINYGSSLLRKAFVTIRAQELLDDEDTKFLLNRITSNSQTPSNPSNAPSQWFVTCFSAEGDDLSQWRAYGGGENGYAIGFMVSGLFGRNLNLVARVNYDESLHKAVANNVANASLKFFSDGMKKNRAASREEWAAEFLPVWSGIVERLAPMVKDKSFKAENEYRVIHELHVQEMSQIKFVQKSTLMSRHLPLIFPPPTATHSRMLPIARIMVGPSRHKEITKVSVDTLLRQNGYYVPVDTSIIPFHQT